MFQYYLGIEEPWEMSDEEYALKFRILEFIRNQEKKSSSGKA